MALQAFTHVATAAVAIQFDGTVASLLSIFSVRPQEHPGITVTMGFDTNAVVATCYIGGGFGSLSFGPGDWVVFPNDTSTPAFVVGDATFQRDWSAA